ncbi:MAG TPA: hypothetical protein PLD25_03845 [Chloroflexota bacterium]|nr:hypothetical protein [Chloroflexota bacterium]
MSHFDHQGVIIGGIAVSLLGQARFTEDLDAMLLLSVEEIPHFLAIAHKEGLVVNQKVNDKERNYARQTESPSSIHD